MKLNTDTLMFEGLDHEEADQMESYCHDLVLKGVRPKKDPPWVDEWLKASRTEPHMALLVLTTAMPQRLLLSVLAFRKDQILDARYEAKAALERDDR